MQLHVTYPDASKCAEYLWKNPVRARKMITETQQILACAQKHFFGGVTLLKVNGEPFKTPKSRMNHPVVKWVCEDMRHFIWVYHYLRFLYLGYDGKGFLNVRNNLLTLHYLCWVPGNYVKMDEIEKGKGIEFFNFAKADSKGLDFTHIKDVHLAYRMFLEAQEG